MFCPWRLVLLRVKQTNDQWSSVLLNKNITCFSNILEFASFLGLFVYKICVAMC